MEASLNHHVDDNIAQCLMMVSTHTDIAIRLVDKIKFKKNEK